MESLDKTKIGAEVKEADRNLTRCKAKAKRKSRAEAVAWNVDVPLAPGEVEGIKALAKCQGVPAKVLVADAVRAVLKGVPLGLSLTSKQKLEVVERQMAKRLKAEFEKALQAEVRRQLEEVELPRYRREWLDMEKLLLSRKGLFPKDVYRRILMRLHPDHGGEAELLGLWKKMELALCQEKDKPVDKMPWHIPTDYAELQRRREEVRRQNSERAKRAAQARKAYSPSMTKSKLS